MFFNLEKSKKLYSGQLFPEPCNDSDLYQVTLKADEFIADLEVYFDVGKDEYINIQHIKPGRIVTHTGKRIASTNRQLNMLFHAYFKHNSKFVVEEAKIS